MKKLLTIAALTLLSLNAMALTIECSKLKRYNRPSNEAAIKLAKHLDVKTCDGQRFKNAVKELNAEISYTSPSAAQVEKFGISKKSINVKDLFTVSEK